MKQAEFYRCMCCDEKIHALRTVGYSEGGIGLTKDTKERGWTATHIPTGTLITPDSSKHKTAKQALFEAEHLISETENILNYIEKVKSTNGYNDFLADRRQQPIEGGLNNRKEAAE